MKITDVITTTIHIPLREAFHPAWLPGLETSEFSATILEIETDEGITGVSALQHNPGVIPPGKSSVNIAVEQFLKPLLVGRDPTQTEKLVGNLRGLRKVISLPWFVSIALWDIVGKEAGMPIYKLWGGYSDKLRAYASFGEVRTPERRAADAKKMLREGFGAIKLRIHTGTVEEDVAQVEAVREEVGDKIDIMVDANQAFVTQGPRWDLKRALQTARKLEPMNLVWLEEPLPRYNFDDIATLCKMSGLRIAGGEDNEGLHEFYWMLEKGAYDVLQPDCTVSEDMFQLRKIAGMAEIRGKWFAPHTWGNGIGLAANLQLAASVPNCPYFEYPYDPPCLTPDVYYGMLKEPLTVDSDGMITTPEGPGLGIELNQKAINKFAAE
ncbi:MAG: mandelate racemase/muconate lactonizing enzyme family protein [Thaumarchaeota archaeon]|nr:mandelate racemase/muconate lactonizing enzyme family protein [Nitrososphaerota archaeon]